MYFVYILKSETKSRYYVGSTDEVNRRLRQHNGELPGLGRSTVAGRPWRLVFSAPFESRSEAMAAERFIKKTKSRFWIEKLIEGGYRLPDF
jgi:putative endonuclease